MRLLVLLLASLLPARGQDKASKIDELLSRYHENRQFNGTALVAESGSVIFKKGYGMANFEWNIPNAPDTRFRLGSITKQFTAAVILQLADEGKLKLDDKLSQFVPDYPKKTADKVTIHHLLTHTSGIPSYTGFPNFFRDKSRDSYKPLELVKLWWEMELEFEPGSKMRYNNSGYHLLGVIIEKVTGKTYAQALEERIFRPLGMTSSGYDLHTPILARRAGAYQMTLDGVEHAPYLDMTIPYAAGSLYSTVEDLHTWNQALYSDQVLPAKTRDKMVTPFLDNYAYGLVVRKGKSGDRGYTIIGHGGGIHGFNTVMERIVEDRHLIVMLNNTGGARLGEMSQGIQNILYGAPAAPLKKPAAAALYKIVLDKGVAEAVKQAKAWKEDAASGYDIGAGDLSMLATHLARKTKTSEAIEIAKLNAELNPKVAFVHYSLGEAYREAGKKPDAIRAYAKALELNPDEGSPVAQRLKEMLGK